MPIRLVGVIVRTGKKKSSLIHSALKMQEATIYHALVVIFLEFFAWGLLTTPTINVLNETFPEHTFLFNGLIMGIKGFLSFLSAPLIGALSDLWGRKPFLLITVLFTCSPIPFMVINTWWFFAMISISGLFSVTFSVVFAYVADVTTESERSAAYGLVSATFAASLVTSPALGAYLSQTYGDSLVVLLATIVAALDVIFVVLMVPESLPDKIRATSNLNIWQSADPFAPLKSVGRDKMIMMLLVAVFLSYLPEAGQYSCFFVYLRLVVGFSQEDVALYIAVVGLLSVIAQTVVLTFFMKAFNSKATIMVGLLAQTIQLLLYGLSSQTWIMWTASVLASFSSITYPAISSYVSMYADPDKQGLVQGMITGMRGLCNGLGPAMFGLVFSLFHVDIIGSGHNVVNPVAGGMTGDISRLGHKITSVASSNGSDIHPTFSSTAAISEHLMPGPPFVFGAFLVMLAMLVTAFIPELIQYHSKSVTSDLFGGIFGKNSKKNDKELSSSYYYTNVEQTVTTKKDFVVSSKTSDSDTEIIGRDNSGHGLSSVVTSNRKRGQSTSIMTCELQMPLMADMDPI